MLTPGNKNTLPCRFAGNSDIEAFVEASPVLAGALEKIRDILYAEHYKERACPFSEEKALNMDAVALRLAKEKGLAQQSKTVDFVVGLEKRHLLLVEAKLDSDGPEHYAKEIRPKTEGTKAILNTFDTPKVYENVVVVLLPNARFEQHKNKLLRLLANRPGIRPLRVADFYVLYF